MICPGCGREARTEHPSCARRRAQGRAGARAGASAGARETDLSTGIASMTQGQRDAILRRMNQKEK